MLGVISLKVDESVTTFSELEPQSTSAPDLWRNETDEFTNRTIEPEEIPPIVVQPPGTSIGEPVFKIYFH